MQTESETSLTNCISTDDCVDATPYLARASISPPSWQAATATFILAGAFRCVPYFHLKSCDKIAFQFMQHTIAFQFIEKAVEFYCV
jgi:hypothetical protein